jgi:hypothetical protein
MMAALGGAERATIFDGQLLVKGFSTMFIPTRRVENSIVWHFLFNEDKTRISYTAAKQSRVPFSGSDLVDYQCLLTSRSFLGWSSSVTLHTG